MVLPRAEIVAEFKKPCLITVDLRHKPFVDGTFNLPPEEYHMKGSILLACLILLFLLVVAGIPVAASPVATDIRPVSAPNTGEVTITITGTGSLPRVRSWMTPSSVCDPSQKIYGTVADGVLRQEPARFRSRARPGLYTVWVNSPIGDLPDLATLSALSDLPGFRDSITSRPQTRPQHPMDLPGPYGTIYVESSPSGAVIYLNDENQGRAPVTHHGPLARIYSITAELAGYQKYTSATTLSVPPVPLCIARWCPIIPAGDCMSCQPGSATVYLDGTLKGETPLMLSDTVSGSHTIQIKSYRLR